MGSLSLMHWIIVLAIVVLLFGRGKISDLMGDVAKGIKTFKKGMAEDETPPVVVPPRAIDHDPAEPLVAPRTENKTTIG